MNYVTNIMTESRIINKKTPKQFSIVDREMIRDIRLNADSKNIYTVLSSLAETCENTCPSYRWLAQEVGYNIIDPTTQKEKSERTINKWVASKINELIELKLVIQINRVGTSYDYEIYDYYPAQKSTDPLPKKVQTPLPKKVPLVIREEKQDISNIKNKQKEKPNLKFDLILNEDYQKLDPVEVRKLTFDFWTTKKGAKTEIAFNILLKTLNKMSTENQIKSLEQAIISNYSTVYEIIDRPQSNGYKAYSKPNTQAQKEIQTETSEYGKY